MSNENQSNAGWRSKLEDPEGLQGECLVDKDAAWLRLQAKLQPGLQKRRKIPWHWIAAACLLVAIGTSLLFERKNPRVIVKESTTKDAVQPTSVIKLPSREFTGIKTPVVTAGPKKPLTHFRKQRGQVLDPVDTSAGQTGLTPGLIVLQPVTDPAVSQPQQSILDQPIVNSTEVIAPKKKLRVVHINQLGESTRDHYPMVHTANDRTMPVKLVNQDIFTNAAHSVNNTGLGIFKSKTIPTN